MPRRLPKRMGPNSLIYGVRQSEH